MISQGPNTKKGSNERLFILKISKRSFELFLRLDLVLDRHSLSDF